MVYAPLFVTSDSSRIGSYCVAVIAVASVIMSVSVRWGRASFTNWEVHSALVLPVQTAACMFANSDDPEHVLERLTTKHNNHLDLCPGVCLMVAGRDSLVEDIINLLRHGDSCQS